jgi:hypothetical protein
MLSGEPIINNVRRGAAAEHQIARFGQRFAQQCFCFSDQCFEGFKMVDHYHVNGVQVVAV